MIRVWCEHLPYEEARSPEVRELLVRGDLHPIFAVRPDSDLGELAGLSRDLDDTDLEVAVWPLLTDDEGYWPSVRNADTFAGRLRSYLEALEERDARPDRVAFDFEPALEGGDGFMEAVRRTGWRSLSGGLSGEAFDRAVATYRSLVVELADAGIATFGVTQPLAVADLGADTAVWQRALETPWEGLPWDSIGVMAYGSLMRELARGTLRYRDIRAMHYEMFVKMRRHLGARAHASVGLVGTGVYGDEPVYPYPDEIARDVSAAKAAGIEDIAVFCLEGLLGKDSPGMWVDAIAEAEAQIPESTWRAKAVCAGASAATRVLEGLHRVF